MTAKQKKKQRRLTNNKNNDNNKKEEKDHPTLSSFSISKPSYWLQMSC